MKALYALAFLISAYAEVCVNTPEEINKQDLKAVSTFFTQETWTSCDYNGVSVSCEKYKELTKQEKDSSVDPNLAMP